MDEWWMGGWVDAWVSGWISGWMGGFVFYKYSESSVWNAYLPEQRNIKYKIFCSSGTWLRARIPCFTVSQWLISNICFNGWSQIYEVCNFSEGKGCVSLIYCVSVALGREKWLYEYLLNEWVDMICMDHYLPSEFHRYAGALSRGRKYCFKNAVYVWEAT